jgi:quinol-cytochrome oxidoreductase complex cytochrome b subunit
MAHESSYVPTTGFTRWLDARLPIIRLAHDSFVAYPTPKNLNYWWTFGGILSWCLMIQIVTGIILAMHYVPNSALAFGSVQHIMRDVNYGWLLRYVHANGASMFFVAVYIHIFRGIYYGSYKSPREVLWILGMVIYVLMMATAFFGYVLPWGQMSFWGATVITNIFGAIPGVGHAISQWLWGGYAVGNPTLNRFFSLHYLFPFLIAGVVVLHVWALHVVGQNNPTGIDPKTKGDTVPFTPYATVKDSVAIALFTLLFAYFVFFTPNALGDAQNFIPANPMQTPPEIVPEWYLLPFYAILRSITFDFLGLSAKFIGVIALGSSIVMLFLLPWLDTSRVRSLRYRPWMQLFFWIFVADCLALGWVGAHKPEGPVILIGHLATAWYFIHFLIIYPLVGLLETPRPIPESISKAVLDRKGGGAGAAAKVPAAKHPTV